MSPEKITPNPENNESADTASGTKWSALERLAGKYNAAQRERVDHFKQRMQEDPFAKNDFEREKIDRPPSTLRRMGRLAMDRLGIHFSSSEKRRDREAMSVAIDEHTMEEDQRRLELEQLWEREKLEQERREQERKEAEARREKEAFDRDFVAGMDWYRRSKAERFQNQRIQEQLEQDLNQRLLTVETLEDEVLAENPEVEKSTVEYEGTEVPIYTLKGIPFSMISHDIEYRRINADNPDHIGVQTSMELVDDPSIWIRNESDVAQEENYGTRSGNAKGNVISASYINSESNIGTRVSHTGNHADICYGFAHLDGGELLYAAHGDGGTSNTVGKNTDTMLDTTSLGIIDRLEGASGRAGYNELLLRRYSEHGEARRPDYIIAENGQITEDMVRHAAFFGIPIVNIDRAVYEEKMESKAVEALESIDENSSYEEICAAIDKIKTTSRYNSRMRTRKRIGDGSDVEYFEISHQQSTRIEDKMGDRLLSLEEMEMRKRVDFIADELQKATEACRQATAQGEEYHFVSDSIAKIYSHGAYDFRHNKHYTPSGEFSGLDTIPANPDRLYFNFRMKGSTRIIETEILDGERREINEDNKENVENSNSSYYDKVYPLIMAYMAAERENQEMLTRQRRS